MLADSLIQNLFFLISPQRIFPFQGRRGAFSVLKGVPFRNKTAIFDSQLRDLLTREWQFQETNPNHLDSIQVDIF